MKKCANKDANMARCNCSYQSCSRKGICCECLHYHLSQGQVPACFFSPQAERTYNRSIDYFISQYKRS